jgi:hypothetical protein
MYEYDRIETREIEHGTFKWLVTDRGRYSHDECERRLRTAVRGMQRWFGRSFRTLTDWKDKDMRDHEVQHLRNILDDMMTYAEVVQQELDRIEGVNRKSERIAALRNVAGRTPEEAEAFIRKAEELEGKA